MQSISARATPSAGSPFEPVTIQLRDLGPQDILIAILYSGICHSDIHTGRDEWGAAHYPLVPGHEIAGVVEAVGEQVSNYSTGDRVGVGCLVDSCRTCKHCIAGNEQFCSDGVGTYNSMGQDGRPTNGGYSTHIVVDERFVVGIPDSLALDVAAPLMCAGITLFSPLRHWKVSAESRVAIVGLGGLGHVGVKLAAAMGAHVTVLSRSPGKEADAVSMGASRYVSTNDAAALEKVRSSFDLIINTVSAPVNLDTYLGLLDVDGTLVNVGAPPEPLSLHVFSLVEGRRSFAGSPIGGLPQTQEMLDFCGQHGIGATIELIAANDIDNAWDRVVASDVRYRFVIETATI